MASKMILGYVCIMLLVQSLCYLSVIGVEEAKEDANTGTWTEWAKDKGIGAQDAAAVNTKDTLANTQDAAVGTKDTLANTATGAGDVASEKTTQASTTGTEYTRLASDKAGDATSWAYAAKEAVMDAVNQGKGKFIGTDKPHKEDL